MRFPSSSIVRILKSMPMVVMKLGVQASSQKRRRRHDLPTPARAPGSGQRLSERGMAVHECRRTHQSHRSRASAASGCVSASAGGGESTSGSGVALAVRSVVLRARLTLASMSYDGLGAMVNA